MRETTRRFNGTRITAIFHFSHSLSIVLLRVIRVIFSSSKVKVEKIEKREATGRLFHN